MQCRGCGKEIPKGNLFCNYCGLRNEPAITVLPQKTKVFEEKIRSLQVPKSELQNTSKERSEWKEDNSKERSAQEEDCSKERSVQKDDNSKERSVQKEDKSKEGSVQKDDNSKEKSVQKEDSSKERSVKKEDRSKERSVQKEDRSKERSVQREERSKEKSVRKDDNSSSKENSVQKEDRSKERSARKEDSSKERFVRKENSSKEESVRKENSSKEESVRKEVGSKEKSIQKENFKKRIQQALLEGVAVILAIAILTMILYIYPDMKAFFLDRPNQESEQVNAKDGDMENVSEPGVGAPAPQEQDPDDTGMANNTEDNDNKETVAASGNTNTMPEENKNPDNIIDYYEIYIEGRNKEHISPDVYHFIENNLEFNLEGLECKDIGNDTMEVKVKLYLMEAAYEDLYFMDYDILLLPMASTLMPTGDAQTASLVLNELGNEVAFPIFLQGYGKRYFELFFYVPDYAKELAVYVTNTSNGDESGPIYEIVYHIE